MYLRVLFWSEGRTKHKINRWIDAASTVLHTLCQTDVKKVLHCKATLCSPVLQVPTLTYSHGLWVVNERKILLIQAIEMGFLHTIARLSHGQL